ncbi:MAG: hypothetical protein WBC82_02745 [Dehalococcoidia bacterium]
MDLTQTLAIFMRRAIRNKWFQGACIAALVFVIYIITSRGSTVYNHYVLLADAFLHGRLFLVDAPPWLELARIGDQAFVINPPAPTLFVLPWVAIWGVGTNQVIISMLVGAAAMGFFWVAATQLGWSLTFRAAMTVLLAFGTNLWWAATDGSVWTLAHAAAVFFLMAALVDTTGKNRPWLIALLVGLAGLSRLPCFLTFPFFAYTIAQGATDRRSLILRLGIFGLVLAGVGVLYLAFNYGQYGTFMSGYYHGEYLTGSWYSKGLFDISYIPRHLNAILFAGPIFTDEFPFFKPSFMGLGLFFTTPALLYIFRARLKGLSLAAIAAILATAIPIVTCGATGFAQFGYRYSLDVLPFLAILVASGMRYRLNRLKIAVILLSCAVNLWGTLSFNVLNWVE